MELRNKDICHLHVHTDASIRDGLGTVSRLFDVAQKEGFTQLGMTDHGSLANAVLFAIEAEYRGMKAVMGMEGYLVVDGEIGHITLLADGQEGWSSLLKLNNLAHASSWRQPAFTIDELVSHSEKLICLTGCPASPLHRLPLRESIHMTQRLKKAFGGRLFAELMFNSSLDTVGRTMELAERNGLSLVITNDVHFPEQKDAESHNTLTRIKSGFDYDSSELWLKGASDLLTSATMIGGMSHLQAQDALLRTGKIASLVEPIRLKNTPRLPLVTAGTFRKILHEKIGEWSIPAGKSKEYKERIEWELRVINEMGYNSYFAILHDIISFARKNDIPVGPGRGSGAGSLLLYVLGITEIDPIEHGLSFERFLNPQRQGMPDVDVDFCSERRGEVIDYAASKWGAFPIATYSRWSHKSLTRDLGKFFNFPQEMVSAAAEGGPNSKEFFALTDSSPELTAAYTSFLGQIRHKGKHAGGVVITDIELPIERVGDTLAAAWSEGGHNELSYAGVVKFDLLGLSALSALKRMQKLTSTYPLLPTDGAKEFEIFCTGNLAGVFQFAGSEGIRQLTMRLQPDKFEDLVAINALYRPGAMDVGSTEKYPEWKESPRIVDPLIADILAPTYGAVVYQEQFMEIYARVVNGSLAEADTARRIITKSKPDDPRWVEQFQETHELFVASAIELHGMDPHKAESLWEELAAHSRYSFNKAHSVAYSLTAWNTAWYKFNYPVEFYTAMLNVDKENEQAYIIEAVQGGITIAHPDINVSSHEWECLPSKNTIFMPLTSIKYLGLTATTSIIQERETNGPFNNVENFVARMPKRMVNKRVKAGLYVMGGFSSMGTIDALKLGIDKESIEDCSLSLSDKQLKYLGFIVPNKRLIDRMIDLESSGFSCGIVSSSEERTGKRGGKYFVYRLAPQGVFWTLHNELREGQVVGVKINKDNGSAQRIVML